MSILKTLFGYESKKEKMRLAEAEFQNSEPVAVPTLSGFEVAIEKKEGVLLKGHPKDEPEKEVDLSIPEYYDVSVRATGENPDYPAQEEARHFRFTTTIPDYNAMGFNGGVNYIPDGNKYVKFEMVENFDDMRGPRMGPIRGTEFPPHHRATLRAVFKAHAQDEEQSMELGLQVRKSEKDSQRWKDAESSPILGMYI